MPVNREKFSMGRHDYPASEKALTATDTEWHCHCVLDHLIERQSPLFFQMLMIPANQDFHSISCDKPILYAQSPPVYRFFDLYYWVISIRQEHTPDNYQWLLANQESVWFEKVTTYPKGIP